MVLIPRTAEEVRQIEEGGGVYDPGSGWSHPDGGTTIPSVPPPTIPDEVKPTITGAAPEQFAGMLYEKDIPVILAGRGAIGGRIIEGPIYGTVDGQHTASWISGYAINANYDAANIEIRELRFRGKRAWSLSGGVTMPGLTIGATVGSAQTVRFSGLGNLTQSPDTWSTSRFGSRAVAYRPMITATFQNIKVAQFNNLLPFTSVVVADDTYCTPGELLPYADALPVLARFAGFEDDEFEATGMTGGRQAYFFAKKQTLVEYLNDRRILKKFWSIRQKEKLYVVEHAVTEIDATVDRSKVTRSGDAPIVFTQAAAITMPRKLNLTYVDSDRDYDLNTVYAELETAPIPATTAFDEQSIEIADVTTADEATAEVNYALYNADTAREKGETTGKRILYTLEVGDQVKYETDFKEYYHRIEEVVRGVGCTIEIKSEGMITCGFDAESGGTSNVILLLHADSEPLIDSSVYDGNVAFNGNAQLDTTVKKFGAASFLLDGAGDFVTAAGGFHPQYEFSPTNTSPYTIELWVRFAAISAGSQILISQNSFAQKSWVLYNPAGTDELSYITSSDHSSFTATLSTTAANLATGTWYHVAVDKDSSGKVRIYVNGVMKASDTPADSVIAPSVYSFVVGADAAGTSNLAGNVDDVRISTVSRYGDVHGNSSFSVPTEPFPDPS